MEVTIILECYCIMTYGYNMNISIFSEVFTFAYMPYFEVRKRSVYRRTYAQMIMIIRHHTYWVLPVGQTLL